MSKLMIVVWLMFAHSGIHTSPPINPNPNQPISPVIAP
jgi:hypothetical protein